MIADLALQEVEPCRRADVTQDAINSAHRQWDRDHRRPKVLSAREALAALQFEALLVWTVAANILNGEQLTDADFDRLTTACRHIDIISSEAL